LFNLNFSFINAFKYRDRSTIVTDILRSTHNRGAKKTQIMQRARLNHIQTQKYLNYMVGCGYIYSEKNTYMLTDKGKKYLQIVEIQMMSSLSQFK
jgi:predicted transcriptional regulator